jgi:magnesium transporter
MLEEEKNVIDELHELLESNLSDEEVYDKLTNYHEADIASAIPTLSDASRSRLGKLLSPDELSNIFSYLDNAEDYLEGMDKERAADIIESMDADDAVDILDEMNEDTRSKIIELMDDEAVEDINLITSYPDDVVGSKMTTNFITVKKDMTVKQAMKTMVEQAAENDNVSTIYVEDENEAYCGAIDLRDLIVARNGTPLEDIIVTSYPYVNDDESIEECIERLKGYSEDSIPVLNSAHRIIGVITSTDLVEAVDEAMSDDYAKLGGLTEEEDLKEPVYRSIKKRIPWLFILFFLGLAVSSVVASFEHVIENLPFIVSFQSLVLDMAGNVGTQSLAVTISVLSDGQIGGKKAFKLIGKEVRVGFINGLILGSLSCLLVGAYLCINNSPVTAFTISGCIGIALFCAMVCSAFFGTVIPVLFKKIKIDPAVASGPLITTINDLVAVVVYYGLAWLLILNLSAI